MQDCFLHTDLVAKGQLGAVQSMTYALGGAPGNVCRCLAELGVESEAIGSVGHDPAGTWVIDRLRSRGIGTSGIRVLNESGTGISMILVTPDGERTIYCYPGASHHFVGEQVSGSNDWAICHLGYPPLLPRCRGDELARLFERLQGMGIVTSLDTVPSESSDPLAEIAPALPYTDVFTPNIQEAMQLAGINATEVSDDVVAATGRFFSLRGVKVVAITLGARGSYLVTAGDSAGTWPAALPPPGLELRAPAFETRGALNTTAAGDSFTAGLLAGLLARIDPGRALEAANLAAALHIEGSPNPTFDDLLELTRTRRTLAQQRV